MRILLFLAVILLGQHLFAQSTIADARNAKIGELVTVSGIVTNGEELGTIKYLQDTSAAIALYDTKLAQVKRGDSISVTGELDDYNNLLEIKNLSNVTIHSSGKILPEPVVLNTSNIGEQFESQLVKINQIEFTNSGTFAGDANYHFTDGAASGVVRISRHSSIVGKPIPSGKTTLTAICSQYSWENNDTSDGYQLLPRDMNDFTSGIAINFTSAVQILSIKKHSIQLGWKTDTTGTAYVRYGNSNNKSALTNIQTGTSNSGEANQHTVELSGLQPSELIYAQAFSIHENDTAFSSIGAYITESNSSGTINLYFNTNIDETLANKTVANAINNNMEDTLAAYISRAHESIDLCIYNFNNSTISTALNEAHNRGVKIRVITCGSTNHYGIQDLNSGIPVLERPEVPEGGIMHNKFAIFDATSNNTNEPWVWSGSTNLTQDQLLVDANNMIFIQDQSLAITYKTEFEEMWGSTGNLPDPGNARFGNQKQNNTPHEFIIGGSRVECYFSPTDNTNQKLIEAIASAESDLHIQTMLITRSDLARAIINAHERNTEVDVITNKGSDNSETVNDILNELPKNKFIFDDDAEGTLHHKMALVDALDTTSNPCFITGSHNWSNSANERNDENTLIIHNADITNQAYQQFAYRFRQNGGNLILSSKKTRPGEVTIFPNPTSQKVFITTHKEIERLQIYSIYGILVRDITNSGNSIAEIDLSTQKSGMYILKIKWTHEANSSTYKIIKR